MRANSWAQITRDHSPGRQTPVKPPGGTSGQPLLQIHRHYQRAPGENLGDVTLRGGDLSVNLAPAVGWRIVVGHFRLEPLLYGGLHTRAQFTRLIDDAHDVDVKKRVIRAYPELGSGLSLGIRIGPRWEVGLDATVPVWVGRTPAIPLGFLQSGPGVGITLGHFVGGVP